ncbi:MAG TPA: POTRA domain-containing protein [Bryobacteraceae bacterium]|nr:POTRA domain-containing protein [Bryobacteraceae bacterium]
MKWWWIVLALAACAGAQSRVPKKKAQAAAPAATAWPIESLTVEGSQHYTADQVLAVAGLKVGQKAGKPEFEEARNRLLACGVFETVGYKFGAAPDGKGYTASFQVTEIEPAYPVHFEDLGRTSAQLETMLHSKDPLFSPNRLPPTQTVLNRYVKWIEDYLDSQGVKKKVIARVTPLGAGGLVVMFRPAGNLPAVAEVSFEGNKVIPQTVLQKVMAGVAVGTPYIEEQFRQLLENSIRPLYEARGHVRVSFPKVRTEPVNDVSGLHVFVTVNEGQSYNLGKVEIAGPTPVSPDELLKAGGIKAGDVANFDRVHDGLNRMVTALRHAGYMQAAVTTTRQIDDAHKTVDVAVHVASGPQFTMGKLDIEGLDLNAEFEMKRIWTMTEGKPFDADYPNFFLNRIREEGLFENLGKTRAETKIDPDTHTVDVTLYFAGAGASKKEKDKAQQPGQPF